MQAESIGGPSRESFEPSRFGQYCIVRELGRGGMGTVYEGRHVELGSRVAVKVMHPALAAHQRAATRFLREARAASQIRHQHVVEVFDIGTQGGQPYLVMELLDGTDLGSLLAEKGPLPLTSLAEIFLPVLSALETAHRAGVIHRDLKPANLLLADKPPRAVHPMVLDFGISKLVDDHEPAVTRSESLLGTVQYMAPELTRGARFATPASDQYALGVMLYECATGTRPFGGESHYEVMHAILTAPVARPSELRPELPPEFDELVLRAMHRDPERRFPSSGALGSALLGFADRASVALYGAELLGNRRVAAELWTEASRTAHDAEPNAAPKPLPRSAATPGRTARVALVAVSAYAVGATVLALGRGNETPAPDPRPELPASEARAPAVTAPTPPPPAPAASSPSLDEPRENPRRALEKPHVTTQAKAPPRPSATAPSPILGTNAAPIID